MDLEDILLNNAELKEVAMVPDLEGKSWLLEGPLLMLTDRYAFELVRTHILKLKNLMDEASSVAILQMICPDIPEWTGAAAQAALTCGHSQSLLGRANSIALRSHPNSSVLWRFRRELKVFDDDELLLEIQNFKLFNYHLFDYLTHTFRVEQLGLVLKMIKAEPNNFSPYHVLLANLRKRELLLMEDVLAVIKSVETVDSEAFIEFAIALELLLKEKGLAWIPHIRCVIEASNHPLLKLVT